MGGGENKKGSCEVNSSDPIVEEEQQPVTGPLLFRSTWRVEEGSKTITLPLVDGYNYDFTVDWGDESPISKITSYDAPEITHTYEDPGDYNLVIEGTLEAWSFNNTGDKDKILSVESFGDLGYKNLSGAFHGCANLSSFEGGIISDVTDMSGMFSSATNANPDVSGWDMSKVTDMTNMFNASGLSTENYDAFLINLADNNALVENVILGATGIYYSSDAAKTARDTLRGRGWTITDGGDYAVLFRSTWRVPTNDRTITLPLVSGYNYNFTVDWGDGSPISEITAYDDLDKTHNYENEGDYNLLIAGLLEAWSFKNTGDKDKILSVENFGDLGYKNLSGAFQGCSNLGAFEGGVTSSVTDMNSIFRGANNANPNVRNWDVSKVTDMSSMFHDATNADPDVSEWVVFEVTNMAFMFQGANSANPKVRDWNVSKVTDMSSMFQGATNANPKVRDWNVSKVTRMNHMFFGATDANPDVSIWDVSKVTDMNSMFSNATSANPNVSNWDVSKVTDMNSMFSNATSANPDVSIWDVSKVTDMNFMFDNSGLSITNYDALLINLAYNNASVENVVLGAISIYYSSHAAKAAKDTLDGRGWTITDAGDVTIPFHSTWRIFWSDKSINFASC